MPRSVRRSATPSSSPWRCAAHRRRPAPLTRDRLCTLHSDGRHDRGQLRHGAGRVTAVTLDPGGSTTPRARAGTRCSGGRTHDRARPRPHRAGGSRRFRVRRRSFLGYVLGGATLVAAADLGARRARASATSRRRPSPPSSTTSTTCSPTPRRPTANLITVTVHEDGTASFALPAHGGRPGHHHLDGDADRRGARPAGREGPRHAGRRPVPSWSSTSSPAAPTPRSRRTPRSGSPPPSPRRALLDAAAIVLGDTVGQPAWPRAA